MRLMGLHQAMPLRSGTSGYPQVDQAGESAVASRVTLDQLVELMPGPFVLLDQAGCILRTNDALDRALGASAESLAGRPFVEIVARQDQERATRFLESARLDRAQAELLLGHGEAEPVPFALVARAVAHDGRPATLVTGTNIADLRRYEAQLILARKGESIGRLVRGVAHDFNNTLAVVMSYAELILMDSEPGDPRRRDVVTIREAATRAAELTRQILVFSRAQAVQPRSVDLNVLVLGLDKLLRRLIGEDVELATILADGLPAVEADPGRLEADIVSGVVEARDRLNAHGSVVIQSLGLPSGARLVIGNSDGPLTTIDLPPALGPSPRPSQAPARGTETVIIAEDNDMVRRGIAAMLSARGFTVLAAANGEEALRLVAAHPEAKLLLADVVMPRLDAAELDARAREIRSDLLIVFMSGYSDDAVSRGVVKPAGFIQKPFSAEALARKVRDVLDAT